MLMDYGHIFVIYYLVMTYRGTNDGGKKKGILLVGGVIILSWFIMIPMLKPSRLRIERKGEKVYEK